MEDFLTQNPLYIVLIVSLAVWAGIYFFLFRLDRKVKQLEQRQHKP